MKEKNELSRRDVLKSTTISAGVAIIPVSSVEARESENNPPEPAPNPQKDIGIYNNSDQPAEFTVAIIKPEAEREIFSEEYDLRGLNEEDLADESAARFEGEIRTPGRADHRIEVTSPGHETVELDIELTESGIPDGRMVTIYLEPDDELTAFAPYA